MGTHERKKFTCGFCGTLSGSTLSVAAKSSAHSGQIMTLIYFCDACMKPNLFLRHGNELQFPSAPFTPTVSGVPSDVLALYDEARACTSNGAFTSACMLCRKIVLHVAHNKTPQDYDSFKQAVEVLYDEHYIPEGHKVFVDHIRDQGNAANHEIKLMSAKETNVLMNLTHRLLMNVYVENIAGLLDSSRDLGGAESATEQPN